MVVYIDQVFFVNGLVDLMLLKTAICVTGAGVRPWRIWAGAGFGGMGAVAACVPALAWLGRLPGAGVLFFGLGVICFGWRDYAWKSWLWFFCVCCGFGGLALCLCALLQVPAFSQRGVVYYQITGRMLVLLAGGLYLAVRLCLDRFARNRGGELVCLELALAGRRLRCVALRDTGNTLADPTTGEPVLVARWQLAARLLPDLALGREAFEDPATLLVRLGQARPALRARLIPFRAVGGTGLLLAVTLDEILENGKPACSCLVAFSPTELSDSGSYEALCQG